jgi:hypothetical protein
LVIWSVLLVTIIAVQVWYESAPAPKTEAGPTHTRREANDVEWALPIADLGGVGLGKRLVFRPVGSQAPDSKGDLVWWHDGEQERVAYLPAPGEDATRAVFDLMRGLRDGTVLLYDAHGDADLQRRLHEEIIANWALPDGFSVLYAPGTRVDFGENTP